MRSREDCALADLREPIEYEIRSLRENASWSASVFGTAAGEKRRCEASEDDGGVKERDLVTNICCGEDCGGDWDRTSRLRLRLRKGSR